MGIEYFEPRPPKVAVLKLDPRWSVGERIEKLHEFPGVKRVTVSSSAVSDGTRYTLELGGGAEPINFYSENANYLTAVITVDVDGAAITDVRLLHHKTLHTVYKPVNEKPLGVHIENIFSV